jgi:hypothetical protein
VGLRIAVHNVIGAFGLNGVVGKNGGPDVAVHIFRLARLDAHFQKPDVVIFEEDFVVLGRRVDRFQGVRPMPNHACLALRPGTGYKSKRDSGKEPGDGRKLALVHDLPPGVAVS